MTQNLQDLFDTAHPNKFVERSFKSAKWYEAMAKRYKDKPHPLAGVPGRKWTDEQKAEHAIRVQLECEAGLRRTTKGTKMSDAARAKMSEAALNRKGPPNNAKQIHTPIGVFGSVKIAAQALDISYCQVGRRMKKDPTNYYYL